MAYPFSKEHSGRRTAAGNMPRDGVEAARSDLLMTDIQNIGHEVGPKVADHKYVVATMEAKVPTAVTMQRSV